MFPFTLMEWTVVRLHFYGLDVAVPVHFDGMDFAVPLLTDWILLFPFTLTDWFLTGRGRVMLTLLPLTRKGW